MNKRVSTNVKLAAIINAKDNDEEEEVAVQNQELQAKIRLRRSSLYGGGARTKIPKIRKSKKIIESPFHTTGAISVAELPPQQLNDSIPPGAHADQFRIVANNTKRSLHDPDRVCINTSSMMEGANIIPQPPWYFGNNNKVAPADSNIFISAARYGFRGSKNIQQYLTRPYEIPSKTKTEHTPKFLSQNEEFVDEWVPPIMAAKAQSINGIETPKLWPENTQYVTGYPKKQLPKSWTYRRETTVDMPERPHTSEALNTWMSKTRDSSDMLRDYARLESTKNMLSAPLTAQQTFNDTWTKTLQQNASSALKHNMSRVKPPYEPHTLMDPSDSIKYSGTTAMIVHTQSVDELKFRLRMDRSKAKSQTPFTVKWQHIIVHFHSINNKLKRGESMKSAIKLMARTLKEAALKGGSETSMSRVDFIQACKAMVQFEDVSSKQISHLYSMFDPMKKNTMRFVEIIGLLAALNKKDQPAIQKLKSLWKLHYEFGLDRNIFDIVQEILSCCAYSVPDLDHMEALFKSEFRTKCYEMSIKDAENAAQEAAERAQKAAELWAQRIAFEEEQAVRSSKSGKLGSGMMSPSRRQSAMGTASTRASGIRPGTSLTAAGEDSSDDELGFGESAPSTAGQPGMPRKTLSVQPQYNICEHYLNEYTLVKVLEQCPNVVAAFDEQLSARLVQCYGADERHVDVEEEVEEDLTNKDFTWIFQKQAPKKEVFTLH